jgi:hypothetical protein
VGRSLVFRPSSAARSSPHRAGLQPRPSPCCRRPSAAPAVTAPIVAFVVPHHAGRGRRPLRSVPVVPRSTALQGGLVRCGVVVACGATLAPSAICFEGCHTHASALSGFFGSLSQVRKLQPGSTLQTRSQPPQAGARKLRPPDSQSVPGCFVRASLRSLPPQASLRSPLHTLAALRPSQGSAPRPPASCSGSFLTSTPRLRSPIRSEVLGMRFGNVVRVGGVGWLALPPPGACGIKRCPRHSRRFRARASLVQLGRSCGNA